MRFSRWFRSLCQSTNPFAGNRRTRRSPQRYVEYLGIVQQLEARALLTVSLSLSANTVNESDALAVRTITLTATNDVAVGVNQTVDVSVAGLQPSDFSFPSGTTITIPAGVATGSVTLVINDDNVVELAEIGTLTLTNPSAGLVGVDPVNGSRTLTVNDNDQATIAINDVTAAEGNSGTTAFTFTVTLTGSVDTAVAIDFATANNTATTVDQDYATSTGTLNFAANAATPQTRQVTVQVNGDLKSEPNESFFVNLANLVAGGRNVVVADNQGIGTISNDDQATITITDVTLAEGNTGTTAFVFTVTLNGLVDNVVAVDFATANGTATTADQDYATTNGTLNFLANTASPQTRQVTVQVTGDQKVELNETFFVNLTNIVAGGRDVIFGDNQSLGTINNEDQATIAINDVAIAEGNAGNAALTFTVTLTGVVDTAVSVDYATANGTATTGDQDYTAANGTLNFTAGTASPQTRPVIVQITGDQKVEVNETFLVNLLNLNAAGRNVVIADNQGQGTINNDDRANITLTSSVAAQSEGGAVDVTATVDLAVDGGYSILVNLSADGANLVESAELVGATNADFAIGLGDGTAVVGSPNTVRLNFFGATPNTTNAPNAARKFTVQLTNDSIVEGIEKLKATLGTITSAIVPAVDINRLTTDDERKVSINLDANDRATVTVLNVAVLENAGPASFTATLNGVVEGGFQIPSFSVSHGNGSGTDEQTEAGDWSFTSVALPFQPNQSHFVTNGQSQNFSVTLRNDTLVELDENFSVSLPAATQAGSGEKVDAAVLAPPTQLLTITGAVGTVQNDDTLITVTETTDIAAITSVSDRSTSTVGRSEDNENTPYSLREAILLSNAARGNQTIQFTGSNFEKVLTPQIALQATLPMVSAPVEIQGPVNDRPDDMLKLQGAATGRILPISTSGVVTIAGLHFTGGKATGTGGTSNGGAIAIFSGGTVNITDAQFSSNSAASNGGAIFAQNTSQLNITGLTFWLNSSLNGGAVYVNGISSSSVSLVNSTLDRNTATTSGGAIFLNNSAAQIRLDHVTVSDNSAGTAAGAAAIARNAAASVVIQNSIVAVSNNRRTVFGNPIVATQDIVGAFTGSGNILWSGNGTVSQGQSSDPVLSSLVDAGGRTYVRVPSNFLAGIAYRKYGTKIMSQSPVMDAANSTSILVDQRGVVRSSGKHDAGAVEVQSVQSRYLEVESTTTNSAGNVATVDWETTKTADVNQLLNGGQPPGATTALDVLLTVREGASGSRFISQIGDILLNGQRPELVGRLPTVDGQKLRLRVVLSQPVNIVSKGLATEDPRTQLTISGLAVGKYRVEVLGLNADNVISGGSYLKSGVGDFEITSSSPSPSPMSPLSFRSIAPAATLDSLFSKQRDLFGLL